MKNTIRFTTFAALLCGVTSIAAEVTTMRPLFNGKDLSGWKGEGYVVEDGAIVCSPKGRNLITEETFSNFILDFEFKLAPGANNGLGIHYPGTGDAAYTGMEIQVLDNTTGQPIQTYALGEALLFRKPEATVDRDQRVHVLFLTTPSVWSHIVVDSDGKVISRSFHKRGPASDPRLVTFGNGEVLVAGSIPYDPVAEREARSRDHKISDRPSVVFD